MHAVSLVEAHMGHFAAQEHVKEAEDLPLKLHLEHLGLGGPHRLEVLFGNGERREHFRAQHFGSLALERMLV